MTTPVLRCLVFALLCMPFLAAQEGEPHPGQSQFDFANGLFHRGFFEDAAEQYQAYLKDYPDAPEKGTAQYRLAESSYAGQHYEEALQAFDAVLAASPDANLAQAARLSRGEVLYFLKRHE